MGNKKIKLRGEIDNKYKWNIEAMYADDEAWNADYAKVSELAEDFMKYKGKLTESADTLLSALTDSDELDRTLEKLFVFSKMKLDEDNSDSASQARNGKCISLVSNVGAQMSFFTPELLSADENVILGYIDENPGLKKYEFFLHDLLKAKDHILSQEEENLLAQLSEVTGASNNIFSMLNDADMTFGKVKNEDGEEIELTHGNYISFMESYDRNVRKEAFEHVYETYKAQINTIAALYSNSVKNDCIKSKIRNYESSRNAALSGNEIPESVYDNLITVTHEYLPYLHDYMNLRKELLGVDELKMYDVYVPLINMPEKEYTFDEALDLMYEALSPLGEDYISKVKQGISDGWIDVYENKGKTSGAYSFGCYDSYPYILLNYTNKLQDVLTIVHEMGHSMHSMYTRENQPFIYGDYSIFVAEVASTVNECLLLRHLLGKEKDPEMKKFLLNRFIEEFRTTVFRQTMFAEFELLAHRHIESGEALTAEWLCSEYDRLNSLYFGDAISHDDYIQYEWSRIPHFYRAYYVYQYATGFSAATAISKRILTEGQPAVEDYKKFLSMGSSAYPVDELKVAGVDMSSKQPVIDAMEMFKDLVDELKSLI